jgi:N-acetyl-anhydromuramyl-L-alanine amidase AmpD
MSERFKPNVDVRILDVPHSSRHGASLQLIVVHDTEGANLKGVQDLRNLGDVFKSRKVSAHVGTDAEGNSGRYVRDEDKAWHCGFYNSPSLGIEQIGFASQRSWPQAQLDETARWIAYWSFHHGIPIRKGAVSVDGRVLRSGVVRHSDLGALGGGHQDPGANYPLAAVNVRARHYRAMY